MFVSFPNLGKNKNPKELWKIDFLGTPLKELLLILAWTPAEIHLKGQLEAETHFGSSPYVGALGSQAGALGSGWQGLDVEAGVIVLRQVVPGPGPNRKIICLKEKCLP